MSSIKMEREKLEDLVAGYALNILDEIEQAEAQRLIETEPEARQLLAEFRQVTTGLALSVAPAELPGGSLARLRQKAGVTETQTHRPPDTAAGVLPFAPMRAAPPQPARPKALSRFPGWLAAAAALVLFVTSAAFGFLWLDASNRLSEIERNNRDLVGHLAASDLKVTRLSASNNQSPANMRLYVDPATNKAYLIAYNLPVLPGDKEYEAWLISKDNSAVKAGLLGSGNESGKPAVYLLQVNGEVENYNLVAITIERKGGVDKPQSSPIMTGQLNA